ncbi:Rho GTPase activating protein [Xanthoria calcicola]
MISNPNGSTTINDSTASSTLHPSSLHSSPHSPLSPTIHDQDRPQSPRDHLDPFPTTQSAAGREGETVGSPENMDSADAPMKAGPYHGGRNISEPVPPSRSLGNSPPVSPIRTASTSFASSTIRPDLRSIPRTSSIDSAISTMSSATSHSHKSSQDSNMSGPADITHLINRAGSAEALIQHLLKEKQQSNAQNAQLWKLVDKQRTLVLGLNQDLDRALNDKERYRKRLKDQLAQIPPVPNGTAQNGRLDTSADSQSPIGNSSDATPIQRSRERDTVILDPRKTTQENDRPSEETAEADKIVETNAAGPNGSVASGIDSHPTTATSHSSLTTRERNLARIETTNLDRFRKTPTDTSTSMAAASQSIDAVVSPNSFTAKRSLPFAQKAPPNPSLQLTESTPISSTHERGQLPSRKLPPAPLKLRPPQQEAQYGPDDHSGSEYEDNLEVDELPAFERGRKKTRQEDDREREAALLREQSDRSRSEKSKGSKPPVEPAKSNASQPSMPSAIKSLSPDDHPMPDGSGYLTTPASLASVLNPTDTPSSTTQTRTLAAFPISPGLPISPRPIDRPLKSPAPWMARDGYGVSPPASPRNGFVGLPLSPRAPRQPIPMPPQTPMSLVSPMATAPEPCKEPTGECEQSNKWKESQSERQVTDDPESMDPAVSETDTPQPRGIFRGLISETYPDLLIPPNALPSISVKVNSSRLKPSRLSYLGNRGSSEDEPVFTLGVSARSDMRELWQVEKPLLSLPHLDHQLKKTTAFEAKLPDRSLFSGHAPARIDARRSALERYFETILDTPMDEKAAIVLCRYLSTHAIEPTPDENMSSTLNPTPGSPVKKAPDGRLVKEGYLTKRGKNFGGWKARFFVLDEPILRYYESPGGTLLGIIKLQNAQIGKQSTQHASQPASQGAEDGDSQYRHAFLILEPKRKDSNNYVRHVLCAESDAERDVWVEALLFYVQGHATEERARPPLLNLDSSSSKVLRKQMARKDGTNADSPESTTFEGLQAMSYDSVAPAHPPIMTGPPQRADADTPSPPSDVASFGRVSQASKPISGPSNGAKIEDAGAWGNKMPQAKDTKEPKKRGIWGFRDRNPDLAAHSDESRMSIIEPPAVETNLNTRPTFGVPLAEAVEFCPPKNANVCLPAVVYRCLEYLEAQDAASEEGIFRLSGSSVVIKALRDRFNNQGDFDFLADGQYYDVHAVASLLKLYLRELPSTVLTRELHLDFLSVLELDSKPKKVAAYNMLVHRLPKANWTLIRSLSAFLIGIVNNSDVNKMNVRNVGIVFSPTLNIPAPVFAMFLTDFDAIFGEGHGQVPAAPIEVAINEPLTPEDIRSPRRQMFSEIPTPSYSQTTFPQKPSYEQLARANQSGDSTGFVPLQPSYEGQVVPGPERPDPSVTSRSLAPDSAVKARRRESSMLLMNSSHRKSSMPLLSSESGLVRENSAFS